MSRYVDIIGWDDAPHLQEPFLTADERQEKIDSMAANERTPRTTGKPSLGAGAIYPVEEEKLLIDPFAIPDHWERGWAMDVGWNRTAALFGAKDPDSQIYYLTSEYYEGEARPVEHAHGIKAQLPWPGKTGCIDPAAENSSQRDGEKLKEEYESLGLDLINANNAVSAGIHHVLILMQSGQLKVFRTLVNWLTEFRLYRRDEKGKVVKKNDHLMDGMRYLLNTQGVFETRPIERARRRRGGEW